MTAFRPLIKSINPLLAFLLFFLFFFVAYALVGELLRTDAHAKEIKMPETIYDFSATRIDGVEQSLADYKGQVVLIVNTASKCGFTPQYEGLQKLYEDYKDRNFVILGFPCNQFGGQEPGTNEEVATFCRVNYGVTFPMFAKIDVNGKNAHPLYKFLKAAQPGILDSEKIKWNFTKFLINREGKPVNRYSPQTKPEELRSDIEKLLAEK
jgi:glutathione peroxidase